MRYISVCSGIEAASVAWGPLGWEPVAFAEIDAFPSAVLAHHFPSTPNLGDISKVDWRSYHGTVDLVVGGTPCQSFSIAGKREGMDGASGLVREYFRLLREVQPKWFVWENVPGAFSSNSGRDFQSILREWEKCGYHVAWRVLDAQYFGVPQRRRRIFAVGHLGNWRYPAEVLFEPESLRGDTQKSGKTRKGSAASTEASPRSHWEGGPHPTLNQSLKSSGGIAMSNQELFSQRGGGLVCHPWPADKASCLNAHFGEKMGLENQHINQGAPLFVPVYCAPVAPSIGASGPPYSRPGNERVETEALAVMMEAARFEPMTELLPRLSVRRLTPTECERLQGFSDGWTDIPWRGKDHAPDGPRYKALGNSMCVNVMNWIGRRIDEVDKGI